MKNTTTILNRVRHMDIFYANLPAIGGHVQSGIRPVVVVSNDKANIYSPVVTVVPLTSRLSKKNIPTHVRLNRCGLSQPSIALCEQVMTLDKTCLERRIGQVAHPSMRFAIQEALAVQLNISQIIDLAA